MAAVQARRGRPRKPAQPPRRGSVGKAVEPIFAAGDLVAIAAHVGLPVIVSSARLAELAEYASEAIDHAVQAAAMTPPAVPAHRRDWCASIAAMARALADGLGVRGDAANADGGWAPWAAHANLEAGINRLKGSVELHDLLAIATPGFSDGEAAALVLLGRLTPGLLALAKLADAAEDHWGSHAARGGSTSDLARRLLLDRLCSLYAALFGRRATVSTVYTKDADREHTAAGPAITFCRAFLRCALDRLGAFQTGETGSDAVRAIAIEALDGKHPDRLAHWLRNANRSAKFGIGSL